MKNSFFLKIIFNLKKPHLIPGKILFKLRIFYNYLFYEISYNLEKYLLKQTEFFSEHFLDYKSGVTLFSRLKKNHVFLEPDNQLPHSEHSVFFSSLSIKFKNQFTDILEIGTYNGKNAFLLSLLFPNANIITIDLPDNDQIFSSSYNRDTEKRKNIFIKKRNDLLNMAKNINMIQKSSVNLLNFKKKFDLIWVDGAHYSPIVCFDILNSINLIKNDGYILCDDISLINYNATIDSLKVLKNEKIIDYKLIYKNIDARKNSNPKKRRFIAVAQLPSKN